MIVYIRVLIFGVEGLPWSSPRVADFVLDTDRRHDSLGGSSGSEESGYRIVLARRFALNRREGGARECHGSQGKITGIGFDIGHDDGNGAYSISLKYQ